MAFHLNLREKNEFKLASCDYRNMSNSVHTALDIWSYLDLHRTVKWNVCMDDILTFVKLKYEILTSNADTWYLCATYPFEV